MPRPNTENDRKVLQAIASGERVTQRSLSTNLGVALGLTNLLIGRLVGKGYVKIAKIGTRQISYLLTASGRGALAQATRESLENSVHLYTQTREQIRNSLSVISEHCDIDAAGQKRVVFYGVGDVAEIAYVSLQSTDLTLVGVVDDRRAGSFFGLPIQGIQHLSADSLGDVPYGHVVVTTVRHAETIRVNLDARAIPPDRVSYLQP